MQPILGQMPTQTAHAFVPHMTVAFRDLTPANFQVAWNGQRWTIRTEFKFVKPL
jgi:2'-5' RNA ligase